MQALGKAGQPRTSPLPSGRLAARIRNHARIPRPDANGTARGEECMRLVLFERREPPPDQGNDAFSQARKRVEGKRREDLVELETGPAKFGLHVSPAEIAESNSSIVAGTIT